jgi:hypothetical protein
MYAEVHVFEGRMCVTSNWGRSSASEIDEDTPDEALGEAIGAHLSSEIDEDREDTSFRPEK